MSDDDWRYERHLAEFRRLRWWLAVLMAGNLAVAAVNAALLIIRRCP